MKRLSTICLLFFCGFASASLSEMVESTNHNYLIKNYFKEVKKFKQKLCLPGDEAKYKKLLHDYRGDGFYVPLTKNGEVNVGLLKNSRKLLGEKQKWIAATYLKLKKLKELPEVKEIIKEIQNNIDLNLSYKYQYEVQGLKTHNIVSGARESVEQIKQKFKSLEEKIFYLLNFKYPVDHLIQRFNYESHLNEDELTKAREIYFRRKIYEDGAINKKGKPDTFYRAGLNTIKIHLERADTFLAEDLRYDLEWLFGAITELREEGLAYYVDLFTEWNLRQKRLIKYYQTLAASPEKMKSVAHKINVVTKKLTDFIDDKQEKVYRYWIKKEPIWRAMYAMDTILFNEVGSIDPWGLESTEVAKVVVNRYFHSNYNNLDSEQNLRKRLNKKLKIKAYPWLNVLFRQGEFSFTYYFIPAVENIYCPPMTKWAMQLRTEKLKLGLNVIEDITTFDPQLPLRYFSRASMVGRIDMSSVWKGYKRIPEMPGSQVSSNEAGEALAKLKSGNYRYLYQFERDGDYYHVFEIDGIKYTTRQGVLGMDLYQYRDPQLFRFFNLKI